MSKNKELIIGGFVVWCLLATYWYTIIHNKLNFANNSDTIDNHILEILLIISVSFVLGYLLRSASISTTQTKNSPQNDTTTLTQRSTKDDLKIVEGIGPAIEKLLNKEGIQTYWQLAETDKEKLIQILTKAGPLYLNHGEGTWAEQATLLRDGKIEEFKKLASTLIGGNRVS